MRTPPTGSVLLLLLLIAIAYVAVPCDAQLVPAATPDMVTADSLSALYLRLESALWLVIRSGADLADKLRRVHETHLTLFETDFRTKGVPLSRLDADQAVLVDAIGHINLTAMVVRDAYLHELAADRKRDESISFARHGINMSYHMERIFNVTEGADFYSYVARKGELQSCDQSTSTVQSAQQLIYDYYHDISTAQLKAYAITQLANMFYTVYDVRNSVTDAERLRRTYMQHSARAQHRVRSLLAQAGRDVWVCDPDDPSDGRHSAQVTRLLQGYVDNEVNLNEPLTDCKKTCPDYQLTRNFGCVQGSHCAANADIMSESELRCGGAVVGCEFISSDMEICHSDNPARRYESIKYTCGKMFGAKTDGCSARKTTATSWTRWLVHCSHCFCYCDEQGPHSDRYFSLRPVLSDVSKNMVITGVAIRKINRIFYWQIIERQLLANAEANATANAALPTTGEFSMRSTFRVTDPHVVDGIDYHTLTHANRSLNLDVLQLPAGSVCTGVRFNVDQGSLRLEIRGTKFHFKSGLLSQREADSSWVSSTINEKAPIPLDGLQVPTRARSKSVPDVRPNRYVQFTPSDKWTDVAQSTVPFIETQTVRPSVAVPLAGIGLYYKGLPEFGGYVAPKVLTFDYAAYVNNV